MLSMRTNNNRHNTVAAGTLDQTPNAHVGHRLEEKENYIASLSMYYIREGVREGT